MLSISQRLQGNDNLQKKKTDFPEKQLQCIFPVQKTPPNKFKPKFFCAHTKEETDSEQRLIVLWNPVASVEGTGNPKTV